jgi:hypothetical protein
MNYTLKGKIAKAHPYQLDTTLTVEGAGAEAGYPDALKRGII